MALTGLGLVKTSLIDFPGEVAATLFIPGCNLRCPYCHNPELVEKPWPADLTDYSDIRHFLEKRAPLLGGVCITGGEPLLEEELYSLVSFCRQKGLKVKLDTNGTLPERLKPEEFDYISMDIKTDPARYSLLTMNEIPGLSEKIALSMVKIASSGIRHEFRTTVVPGIVDTSDITVIGDLLKSLDSTHREPYILTQFRPDVTLHPDYHDILPYTNEDLQNMAGILEEQGIDVRTRTNTIENRIEVR